MPTDVAELSCQTLNSGMEQLRRYRLGTWVMASGEVYSCRTLFFFRCAILAAPSQSPTGSDSGRRIESYVQQYLTRNLELASSPSSLAGVSYSPLARSATMNAWEAKKRRRNCLINKKYSEGLDARETTELDRLKSDVAAHIEAFSPRTGDVLDEQALRLERLRQKKVIAKKAT